MRRSAFMGSILMAFATTGCVGEIEDRLETQGAQQDADRQRMEEIELDLHERLREAEARLDEAQTDVAEQEQRLASAVGTIDTVAEDLRRNASEIARLAEHVDESDVELQALRARLSDQSKQLERTAKGLAAVRERLGREELYAFDGAGSFLGPLVEYGLSSVKYFDAKLRIVVEVFLVQRDEKTVLLDAQDAFVYFADVACEGATFTIAEDASGSLGVLDQSSGAVLTLAEEAVAPRSVGLNSMRGLFDGATCITIDTLESPAWELQSVGHVQGFQSPVGVSTAEW